MGEVEIRRSKRRRRTIQAYRQDGRTIVLVPDHLTATEEREHVQRLVARLDRRDQRRHLTDADLSQRADRLWDTYLGGERRLVSVRWVGNQNERWGSCTSGQGTIRLSDRMIGMPDWVIDHVLLHELAHLIEPNHGPRFKALIAGYPHADRAEAFLDGVTWQRRRSSD